MSYRSVGEKERSAKCTLKKLIRDKLNHLDTWSRRNRRRCITHPLHLSAREAFPEWACLPEWTRFEPRPKFHPSLPSRLRLPPERLFRLTLRSFTTELPHYTSARTVTVFTRQINYLTNNCLQCTLCPSSKFYEQTVCRTFHRPSARCGALFLKFHYVIPSFGILRGSYCEFYDRARITRAHDNVRALATGAVEYPTGNTRII